MSEDFGSDYITITDEDGKDYELEHLDTIEFDGAFYMALLPADMDENSEDYGIVILRTEEDENGDQYMVVPDDEETERVYNIFMERLFNEDDDEQDRESD